MEGSAPLCDLADCVVNQLIRRIVSANAEGLVVRAFPRYVLARVMFVAERALVRGGVAISLG